MQGFCFSTSSNSVLNDSKASELLSGYFSGHYNQTSLVPDPIRIADFRKTEK